MPSGRNRLYRELINKEEEEDNNKVPETCSRLHSPGALLHAHEKQAGARDDEKNVNRGHRRLYKDALTPANFKMD